MLDFPVLGHTIFLLYINDLPDDAICDIVISADDTSVYSRCDQTSVLWQLLDLNLIYTRYCGMVWKVACWFQCWFCLTGLISQVLLMWKWMDLFLRKNHLLRCWGWLSLQNWIEAFTSLFSKLPPWKLEPWFVLWSFFLLRLLCVFYDTAMHRILLSRLGWCL